MFRLATLGFVVSGVFLSFGATYYVSPTGDSSSDCSTSSNPCPFQKALSLAASDGTNSTIIMDEGTYDSASTYLYSTTSGDGNLYIRGAAGIPSDPVIATRLIIDNDSDFDRSSDIGSNIYLSFIRFEGNNDSDSLYIKTVDANIDISEVVFSGNNISTHFGVAYLRTTNGTITLLGVEFNSNSNDQPDSSAGLKAVISGAGTLDMSFCHFKHNAINAGGAGDVSGAYIIVGRNGRVIISDCIFQDNSKGPALNIYANANSQVEVTKSKFISNLTKTDDGIFKIVLEKNATANIGSNIFHQNTGSGIYAVNSGVLNIVNNTFYKNNAKNGGGIYVEMHQNQAGDPVPQVNIENNIVFNNSAYSGLGNEVYIDGQNSTSIGPGNLKLYNNLIGETADFTNPNSGDLVAIDIGVYDQANNLTGVDPQFSNPNLGDFHLLPTSPLIDAGNNSAVYMPDRDFESDPRRIDGNGDSSAIVDIGADEYNPSGRRFTLTVNITGGGSGTVTSTPGGISCPGDCSEDYLSGYVITLRALPSPGSSFGGWNGDCNICTTNICNVTMYTDRTCEAIFNPIPAPTITVNPSSVNFGNVTVGYTVSQIIEISNSGTADLTIDSISISGGSSSEFSFNVNGGSSPCGSLPATVAPSNTCTIEVSSTPSTPGVKSASLVINSNDPTTPSLNVSLEANAVDSSSNNPPTVTSFTASPESGKAPLSVDFACEGSDSDGSITQYRFDFGDGTTENSSTGRVTHTYNNPGTYSAECTVIDNLGATASSSISIQVQGGGASGGGGGGGGCGGGCSVVSAGQSVLMLLFPLILILRRMGRALGN